MIKSKKMFLSIPILLFAFCFSFKAPVNAANNTPAYTHAIRYSRGVSNTTYWVSSSASSYSGWANNAANLWVYNGWANPIYMAPVSSSYATHMDIYANTPANDSILSSNTNAYTTIYNSNGVQMSFNSTSNYFYAEIVINKSSNANQATIVHEMGHCFGLDHYGANPYSIMYPTASGRKVSTPQQCDVNTINVLY